MLLRLEHAYSEDVSYKSKIKHSKHIKTITDEGSKDYIFDIKAEAKTSNGTVEHKYIAIIYKDYGYCGLLYQYDDRLERKEILSDLS